MHLQDDPRDVKLKIGLLSAAAAARRSTKVGVGDGVGAHKLSAAARPAHGPKPLGLVPREFRI